MNGVFLFFAYWPPVCQINQSSALINNMNFLLVLCVFGHFAKMAKTKENITKNQQQMKKSIKKKKKTDRNTCWTGRRKKEKVNVFLWCTGSYESWY